MKKKTHKRLLKQLAREIDSYHYEYGYPWREARIAALYYVTELECTRYWRADGRVDDDEWATLSLHAYSGYKEAERQGASKRS